jgi:serine phosphatase RsbU (regulator of sigma subunit)
MPRNRVKPRKDSRFRNRDMAKAPEVATVAVNVPLLEEMDSLVRERIDLHAQLFEAAQIQRKLSGPRSVRCGRTEFASEVFAARYLSGDFALLSQNGSKVLATLGDIAGKGFAAGMWFTNLAGLLQSYGHPDCDPARTVTEVNRHLCYLRPAAPFVTVFLAQIDCNFGQVAYCNAGHFPPILLRAEGQAELLEVGGPLLGAVENAVYQSGRVSLEPGDTLLAYSDGVLECRNEAGEEFGSGRLLAALQQSKRLTARNALMALLAEVQDFANGKPLSDDVSLTVIRRSD